MPKNKGKGGKNRRRGKNENETMKRELIYKEDGQEYAKVEKILGNGRLEADCFDGKKRLCHIRGKLRKKVWINQGDIILVGLRDYQDNKADVIMKYNAEEARNLKAYGEIPDNVKIEEDNDIEFDAAAAQIDPVVEGQSEEEESDESEEDDEDEEEEETPSWASKNPTRNTKWSRNQQRGKKNNENFIEKSYDDYLKKIEKIPFFEIDKVINRDN